MNRKTHNNQIVTVGPWSGQRERLTDRDQTASKAQQPPMARLQLARWGVCYSSPTWWRQRHGQGSQPQDGREIAGVWWYYSGGKSFAQGSNLIPILVTEGERKRREDCGQERKRRKSWCEVPISMASILETFSCEKFSLILLQAGVELRDRGGGSYLEVELGVVSLAIGLYTMPANDMSRDKHVNGEESRTKNRALRDPTGDSVGAAKLLPEPKLSDLQRNISYVSY